MPKKRPSQYHTFDPVAKKIRDAAIKLLANIYIVHTLANGGKCRQNFVKSLINQAQSSSSSMNITWYDIRHKVGRIQRQREQHGDSSPLILPTKSNESPSQTIGSAVGFNI